MKDRLYLALDWTGTLVHSEHDVDPEQYERDPRTFEPLPVQSSRHMQDFTLMQLDVRALLGLANGFGIELAVPIRLAGVSTSYLDFAGAELTGFESIHHRSEVLFGVADIEVRGRFLLRAEEPKLELSAGFALPTGRTEPDPFVLGARGLSHQHIFFGTGTFDPVASLSISWGFDDFRLIGHANGRVPFGRNFHGYRAGARISGGVLVETGFGLESIAFRLGPEIYVETPNSWSSAPSVVDEDDPNSGRVDLIASGGVWWRLDAIELGLTVRVPFTLETEGGQLTIPAALSLSMGYSFDL